MQINKDKIKFRDMDLKPIVFDFISKEALFYKGEFSHKPRYKIPFEDIELEISIDQSTESASLHGRWALKLIVKSFYEKYADNADRETIDALSKPLGLDFSLKYRDGRIGGIYQIKDSRSRDKIKQIAQELSAKTGCKILEMDEEIVKEIVKRDRLIFIKWLIIISIIMVLWHFIKAR